MHIGTNLKEQYIDSYEPKTFYFTSRDEIEPLIIGVRTPLTEIEKVPRRMYNKLKGLLRLSI